MRRGRREKVAPRVRKPPHSNFRRSIPTPLRGRREGLRSPRSPQTNIYTRRGRRPRSNCRRSIPSFLRGRPSPTPPPPTSPRRGGLRSPRLPRTNTSSQRLPPLPLSTLRPPRRRHRRWRPRTRWVGRSPRRCPHRRRRRRGSGAWDSRGKRRGRVRGGIAMTRAGVVVAAAAAMIAAVVVAVAGGGAATEDDDDYYYDDDDVLPSKTSLRGLVLPDAAVYLAWGLPNS
mmetsp:Transcript_47145/g.100262  ORF Transcript_47145/g.100262 Transcript_47145/m.100262 type:complete len:229 (-) Transcript_47145:105-791(-)